jgi:Family of unknown function (DUF5330)
MPYREIADFHKIRLDSAVFILTVRNMFSLQFAPSKGVDMRIIRTIIVLSGIAAFMPSAPDDVNQAAPSVASAENSDTGYLEVATNTFSDLASFCARQPGVCETAGFVAHKLELKAKYGVRLIYDWANEASTMPAVQPELADGSDPIETGSMKLASAKQLPQNSQSTLRLDDLIPVWRGPTAAKTS